MRAKAFTWANGAEQPRHCGPVVANCVVAEGACPIKAMLSSDSETAGTCLTEEEFQHRFSLTRCGHDRFYST